MNEVIEKASEMLEKEITSKGVLTMNIKILKDELEDMKTRACFAADQIKAKGMPEDDKQKEKVLADYFTHFCNGVAYGYVVRRLETVLKASGVE